jgi:hypothetical protein
MKLAVGLSDLPSHDALAVIEALEELTRYLHAQPGSNASLVAAFEDFTATCRGRS